MEEEEEEGVATEEVDVVEVDMTVVATVEEIVVDMEAAGDTAQLAEVTKVVDMEEVEAMVEEGTGVMPAEAVDEVVEAEAEAAEFATIFRKVRADAVTVADFRTKVVEEANPVVVVMVVRPFLF